MTRLIFAVSDTQECRAAVKSVVKLFGARDDVELTLLHVSQDIVMYAQSGVVDYETIENIENERSNEILDEFEAQFKNVQDFRASVKKILRSGNPIDVMLEIAPDFDLLVIGASESNMFSRIFVSHQNGFVNASPIPVLVAK